MLSAEPVDSEPTPNFLEVVEAKSQMKFRKAATVCGTGGDTMTRETRDCVCRLVYGYHSDYTRRTLSWHESPASLL